MSVVFVEHDMHMVQAIADWVVVMAEGRIVAEGVPAEVMRDRGRGRLSRRQHGPRPPRGGP